jgi:acyl-CoA thioester hydrolase
MENQTQAHHFPIKLHLRLDWSEMDMYGHINNVMFFKFVQASRVGFWQKAGLANGFYKDKIGPILVSTGCQFSKPLFYPDNIVVEVRLEFIKTTSIGLHHRILNGKGELSAEAHDVIVLFDFDTNEKVVIPAELREAMEKFK